MTPLALCILTLALRLSLHVFGHAAQSYPRILHALGGSEHTETRL